MSQRIVGNVWNGNFFNILLSNNYKSNDVVWTSIIKN